MIDHRDEKGKGGGAAVGTNGRPVALTLQPDGIPDELKASANWLVWKYVEEVDAETGEVDWDKPPRNARTGGLASSTNPKTWAPFEVALAAYLKGGLDGIGFVLHCRPGDDEVIVAIDLDHCRDPQSGAIEPWAQKIIEGINSYTEVSPSGTGIRIFLRGPRLERGRKKGPVEVYCTARYVTCTGQHVEGTPHTVERRPEALAAFLREHFPDTPSPPSGRPRVEVTASLDDAEIIRRAGEAKNGAKFKALWSGSHGYPSGSEADLALVNYLAFWCGPHPERIDALFRQSGLFRSKWQRDDYRDRTIAKALEGRTEFFTGPRPRASTNGGGHDGATGQAGGPAGTNGDGGGSGPEPGGPTPKEENSAKGRKGQTPSSPTSPYSVVEGKVCRRRVSRDTGEYDDPLCNFNAKITAEVVIDDGSGELRRSLNLEGALYDGSALSAVTIPASEFDGMSWVTRAWGCHAIVNAGQGNKDHLRAAVQTLSGRPPRRVVYQHTGWRKIGGAWVYLHAGGALGKDGPHPDVLVDLAPPLERFLLPAAPSGVELQAAINADLRLLDLGPPRLMFPIFCAVYRAALGECDSSVHATGHTGKGKSETIALAQQHYGAGMDRLNLPCSWASTANALEAVAFLAKDTALTVDDFRPGGGKGEIDQLHAKADRLFRGKGNNAGRSRCKPDGTTRPERPPRAFLLSTGEDVPRGESLRARVLTLNFGQGDICLTDLTSFQRDAAAGVYTQVMSAFVCWLAGRYEAVRSRLREEFAAERDRALKALEGCHARTPGVVADLSLGLRYFLDFAVESGAITGEKRVELLREGWAALLEAAEDQAAEVASQDPATRFLRLLAAAVTSGVAHVAARDGTEPAGAEAWGWRREEGGSLDRATVSWRPQGRLVGWVDGDELFLDPEASYAVAQRLGEEQGERLALSQRQLHKRINERKLLVSREGKKLTTRRTLQGRERAVLHLRRESLTRLEVGEVGEQEAGP